MKIYLLPGLGFDHRIFARLDLGGLDVEYINWIEPKDKEPIRAITPPSTKTADIVFEANR